MLNKKGFILAITTGFALVFTLLGVSAIYLSSLQSEAQEKRILGNQAFWLAEGGANHALSVLKNKIRLDLNNTIQHTPSGSVDSYARGCYLSRNALGLLSQYGGFTVTGNKATLNVTRGSLIDLGGGVKGTYDYLLNPDTKQPDPSKYATVITLQSVRVTHPASPVYNTYRFYFTYSITSTGSIVNSAINNSAIQKKVNLSNGKFDITVQRDNFARFALFTNHHASSSGGETIWFTEDTNFSGPLFTNERFSFANNPSGHFTADVIQSLDTARFYNNGSSVLLNADHNGTKDVPVFDRPFQRSQDPITLPSSLTQQAFKSEALGGMSEPTTNGVYVGSADGTQVSGGIYVVGPASLGMSAGANGPVYTITPQGSAATTVTVNYLANTTTVGTKTYIGLPDGMTQSGGALIYAKNNITSFSGTVQKDSLVTVASESDIVITNNIQYEKDPRVPGNEIYNNLLGIVSWGGNVRIGTSAPNNININGVVMAPNGVFTVDNYDQGSPRGTATLLGGVITNYYGAFGTFSGSTARSGYGRNFVYDNRMLNGVVPLYFPFLPNFIALDKGLDDPLAWQEG